MKTKANVQINSARAFLMAPPYQLRWLLYKRLYRLNEEILK